MGIQKTHIEQLLRELVFIPGEETLKILAKIEGMSDSDLAGLLGVLYQAKAEQDEMVKTLVTADPEFPKKLEQHMRAFTSSIQGDVEKNEALTVSVTFDS